MESSSEESASVVSRLTQEDPNLGQFLDDHFKTEEYAMQVVKSSVVANVLNELNNSINLLNNELHQQIRFENYAVFFVFMRILYNLNDFCERRPSYHFNAFETVIFVI